MRPQISQLQDDASKERQAEGKHAEPQRPRAEDEPPRRERRSRHRVEDDAGTGQGSQSAWSKLRMLERRLAQTTPRRSDDF
jgi:hypothetical protein